MKSGKYKPSEGGGIEYVHLDVDGPYQQNAVSGILSINVTIHLYFLCLKLTIHSENHFSGRIVENEKIDKRIGGGELEVKILRDQQMEIRYKLPVGTIVRTYRQISEFFDSFELEVDHILPHKPVMEIDTNKRPLLQQLPEELKGRKVTVREIFNRAGFGVSMSGSDTAIDLEDPQMNPAARFDDDWKPCELHDAMSRYWSRGDQSKPDWAIWVLCAGVYHAGSSGQVGLMFDMEDDFQRQGAVLFYGANILSEPGSETLVNRRKFFFACHEIGHAFNLAHPDDPPELPYWPWVTERSGNDSSFMKIIIRNYKRFQFRFRDDELTFLRHAPRKLVKMGASRFLHANVSRDDLCEDLKLSVVVDQSAFEFLEPVMIELQLENISHKEIELDKNILIDHHNIHITVEKEGASMRDYTPFMTYTLIPELSKLKPLEKFCEPLFLSYSKQGWIIDTPGNYIIRAAVRTPHGVVRSLGQMIRVWPPNNKSEERFAQNFFTNEVGQVMAFDGTCHFHDANEYLDELKSKMSYSRAALHARITLAMPKTDYFKNVNPMNKKITLSDPDHHTALGELEDILITNRSISEISLGRLDYAYYLKELETLRERMGRKAK